MQTQLQRERARRNLLLAGDCRDMVFSVAEARRALPYVSAIARDAAEAFAVVQASRLKLSDVAAQPEVQSLRSVRDAALRKLNNAIDDCNAVGVDLVDIGRGELRFWAEVDGRRTSLTWRMGDPVVDAWRDVAVVQPT